MKKNTVTPERVKKLASSAEYHVSTAFGKCTIVAAKLENGFVIVESSACVDPENYDLQMGVRNCYEKIESKIWELEGYALQQRLFEEGK